MRTRARDITFFRRSPTFRATSLLGLTFLVGACSQGGEGSFESREAAGALDSVTLRDDVQESTYLATDDQWLYVAPPQSQMKHAPPGTLSASKVYRMPIGATTGTGLLPFISTPWVGYGAFAARAGALLWGQNSNVMTANASGSRILGTTTAPFERSAFVPQWGRSEAVVLTNTAGLGDPPRYKLEAIPIGGGAARTVLDELSFLSLLCMTEEGERSVKKAYVGVNPFNESDRQAYIFGTCSFPDRLPDVICRTTTPVPRLVTVNLDTHETSRLSMQWTFAGIGPVLVDDSFLFLLNITEVFSESEVYRVDRNAPSSPPELFARQRRIKQRSIASSEGYVCFMDAEKKSPEAARRGGASFENDIQLLLCKKKNASATEPPLKVYQGERGEWVDEVAIGGGRVFWTVFRPSPLPSNPIARRLITGNETFDRAGLMAATLPR